VSADARLTRRFFQRDPVTLAKALLGQRLVRADGGRRVAGLIVEVEAYLGERDAAAHTFGGRRTKRNQAMWGPAGHAYVYFTYGMHHCVNIVAQRDGVPEAVLIRALEPTEGLGVMRVRRAAARRDTDLCSGPAKLTQALGIDLGLNGEDLVGSTRLFIERARARRVPEAGVVASPRIGVDYAGGWAAEPLRFHLRDHPHVSRP